MKYWNSIKAAARMRDIRRDNERREMMIKTHEEAEAEKNQVVDVKINTIHSLLVGNYFTIVEQWENGEYRSVQGIGSKTEKLAEKDAMKMAVACWGNVNVVEDD